MSNITKRQDDDGHWYWIPNELLEKFENDLSKIEGQEYMNCPDLFDNFNDEYDKYRTGGSPELIPEYLLKTIEDEKEDN